MAGLTLRPTLLSALLLSLAIAPALGQTKKKPKTAAKPKPVATAPAKPVPPPKVAPARRLTDSELVTRLHELVRAKGEYVQTGIGGDYCRRLGSRPIGNCEVFRAEFTDNGKVMVAFYSNNDARKNALHLFITSHFDEPNYTDDYRVGLDGKLERAVRRRGEAASHLPVIEAGDGFKRVMDFLRSKLEEQLAALPDAKLVDDGSCPQGKVKRVMGDAKEAVCLDRARLEARAR
jgi:hypothetical protein